MIIDKIIWYVAFGTIWAGAVACIVFAISLHW